MKKCKEQNNMATAALKNTAIKSACTKKLTAKAAAKDKYAYSTMWKNIVR